MKKTARIAKIPLIDPALQSLQLADGRQLTWQEFGAPAGRPVLYFHGGGSCSFEAGLFHREALQRNLRLVATNRPGAGGSSLCPGRPVTAYAEDLGELLTHLGVHRFACLGESNGGLITLAVAATMAGRVLGGVPINPTVPWSDPVARRVSSAQVAWGYRLIKYAPRLTSRLAQRSWDAVRAKKAKAGPRRGPAQHIDLVGPPPGTEPDIADFQWQVMGRTGKEALLAEIAWSVSDWGFDYYAIPTPLDFFCGVYDAQAPFALVLADSNPDARFHHFSFGHNGFSHPDARRRVFDVVAGYFEPRTAT